MSEQTFLACPLCGSRFDTAGQAACQACPMHQGCNLVCCPGCGYQMVDVRRSRLGRLADSILSRRSSRQRKMKAGLTLSDVPPGYWAKVVGFREEISLARRAHLQAYGVVTDEWVWVLQHSPVTVIQIDQTELALENSLASEIEVQNILKGEVYEDRH